MEGKTAVIIGATGLIGSYLLEQLLDDPTYNKVKLIVRRPFPINDPKAEVSVIDFTDHASFKNAIEISHAVFCAVGTTQKKVKGDKIAYRKVDYDIPVTAAKLCAETGVQQFLLVSAVGANSNSGNFYLNLKGEVEDAVKAMNIPAISIFRPSLLMGKHPEARPGESAAQLIMPAISFLLPSKYKPIHARDVAKAMIAASKDPKPRFKVYEFKEMKNLIA